MSVLLWLAVIEVLGVIAFPIAFVTLRPLRDRGYSVAKPLGLLLMAYPAWLAGSWGAVPVGRAVIVVVVAGMAAASGYLAWRRRREIQRFLKQEWRLLAAMETVFLVLFLAWAAFRAYDPLINHTEQLMDFALLNTAARASSYPPEDPWLRGFAVNYYYFGYLCMGLLTRLTGVSSAVTYNLSLALVPAMAGVGVLGLVVSLVSRAGATLRTAFALGLLGVALLGLLANGEAALELVRARGFGSTGFWEGVGIKGLQEPAAVTSWFPRETWWWWRATRVIDTVVEGQSLDYTIHEFPLFSFFLGDLHPHVMSIPFLLLLLALLFSAVSGAGRAAGSGWLRRCWPALLLTGLVLGALGAVNTWDAPTFAGLSLGLLALKGYHDVRRRAEGRALVWTGLAALAVVGLAGLLYLPFYLGLQFPDSSIAPVRGPVTQLGHFAIVWAVFIVLLAPFLVSQLRSVERPFSAPCALAAAAIALTPFVAWVGVALSADLDVGAVSRLVHLSPGLLVLALLVYRILQRAASPSDEPLLFTLSLLAFAGLLVMGPELFYVRDVFDSRLNTVFKLYYQAWVVLAVAAPVALYYGAPGFRLGAGVRNNGALRRAGAAVAGGVWPVLMTAVLLSGAYYMVGALWDKSGGFGRQPTLDGLAHLKPGREGEYEAIRWLRESSHEGEGLLEAVGRDYSDYGRVSAATGLPTVLAWPGHERQWRGSFEPVKGREQDVADIYQGTDPDMVRRLLRRYDIRYVVIGPRERDTYGQGGLPGMTDLMEQVFAHGDVAIYRVME